MVNDIQQRRQENTVEKRQSLSKWCWETWAASCKRMKLEHSLTPYTKKKSKWIKGPNEHADTIQLLEENRGRTLFEINCDKISSDPHPRVMKIKTKIHECDLIKIKSFYTAK